jgi:serine-type D-Ala-D-Ala carboxypeptidase/endopeptidase (penicillin-binding protein 4)
LAAFFVIVNHKLLVVKNTMLRYLVPFLLIVTQTACAQTRMPDIETAYSTFVNDAQLKYGLSSLTVMDAKTGEVVFSKNGTIGLAPASTLKTVTAATAYHVLGEDFKWETTVGYTGTILNGTLNGDIIITGSGDPTLGSDRYSQSKADVLLNRWVAAVKKAGVSKVNGRIIGNDRLFGTQITPLGWIWQDIGNYYGAGATSLSWRENEIGVKFRAGDRPGDKTELIGLSRSGVSLKLVNEVITGKAGSGDNVYAYSSPYTDVVYLRGTYGIDLKKTILISIPDPALALVAELKGSLQAAGIPTTGSALTTRILDLEREQFKEPATTIDTYRSPSLSQVVYWLNQKSLNLYAENVLKTIASKGGNAATTENGVEAMKKFWFSKLGIDPNALGVLDGSGLSPENRLTTSAMTTILQSVAREPWYNSFLESLPLNNDMKMKSGSIRNVLAYAGFHRGQKGRLYAFSFITNNYSGSTSAIKQKMFKVLDDLK